MRRRAQWCLGLWCLLAATVACAQNCNLPVPFQYTFQNHAAAALSATNAGDPCALTASLNASSGPTAAAFLHYRRPTPTTSVRYGFRIDTSALANFTLANRAVQLFAASSPVVTASPFPVSNVLLILLAGGGPPVLRFQSAYSGVNPALITNVQLTQTLNTVRFEINVGSGTAGSVSYWLNHAFSDPPDGVIDNTGAGLNNAAWIGVIGAELGLSSPTNHFRTDYAGSAVVFDQIESSDDLPFWDDFENGAQ